MGKILVGTASWTDPSLIKSKLFYPKDAKTPEDRLRYYASRFPLVEVDSSYYAMPSASNSEKWVERTPAEFVFNLKAFRLFTGHQTPQKMLPKDIADALQLHFVTKKNLYYKDTPAEIRDELWRRFEIAIRPLKEAGKLQAVHFQFPHWVKPAKGTIAHIEECVDRLSGYTLAVEFRSIGWFDGVRDAETLDWEQQLGVVHVVVDEPQNIPDKSIPQVWATTNPRLAIVRLHGRNEETWDIKGATAASDRFDYDYSTDELDDLAIQIRELSDVVDVLHVIFNNNYEDQGVRNGTTMMERLGLPQPREWTGPAGS
ncbi:DUF72 domain-containing protein [Luteimonas aestuarii]|uniref:DUF72 domain-containing protein n=1 Tax=Luteimonas aestuarii TaxID=453837 RepID=A0A4R5TYC6_9GAMM|nr:DUF72 domain-containing protein [Luteimonas aestuarii]TDK26203.1 DUF72 domain-containing protein [Luteimonas aestuarii]